LVMIMVSLVILIFCGNAEVYAQAEESTENYEIQDSIALPWENWMDKNNCYAYAIDRYLDDPESNSYCNPGYFSDSGSSCSSIQDVVNATEEDLEELCNMDITISTTCPVLSTLPQGYSLICIRTTTSGAFDYHFMRYNSADGFWYHKPGNAGTVMKYKTQPSVNIAWTSEYVNINGVAYAGSVIYDSVIYYISYKSIHNRITDRYEIQNYNDLKFMRNHYNNCEKEHSYNLDLLTSITIPNSDPWVPINVFYGTFYGNNKTISGFSYQGGVQSDIGFIKNNFGIIKELRFSNSTINITGVVNINQTVNIGTIAAVNNCIIDSCQVGTMRIYGEASIMSNTQANAGGVCGYNKDNASITECSVQYFGSAVTGNLGGIAGLNACYINECSVGTSTLSIYNGAVGGIVGKNEDNDEVLVEQCTVSNVDISCYNGYPDIFPEYYPTAHYGYAGGIVGWNDAEYDIYIVFRCNVTYTNIMCNSDETTNIYPEMGNICGRTRVFIDSSNEFSNNNITAYNLTENQKIYVKPNDLAGRLIS